MVLHMAVDGFGGLGKSELVIWLLSVTPAVCSNYAWFPPAFSDKAEDMRGVKESLAEWVTI